MVSALVVTALMKGEPEIYTSLVNSGVIDPSTSRQEYTPLRKTLLRMDKSFQDDRSEVETPRFHRTTNKEQSEIRQKQEPKKIAEQDNSMKYLQQIAASMAQVPIATANHEAVLAQLQRNADNQRYQAAERQNQQIYNQQKQINNYNKQKQRFNPMQRPAVPTQDNTQWALPTIPTQMQPRQDNTQWPLPTVPTQIQSRLNIPGWPQSVPDQVQQARKDQQINTNKSHGQQQSNPLQQQQQQIPQQQQLPQQQSLPNSKYNQTTPRAGNRQMRPIYCTHCRTSSHSPQQCPELIVVIRDPTGDWTSPKLYLDGNYCRYCLVNDTHPTHHCPYFHKIPKSKAGGAIPWKDPKQQLTQ